MCVYRMDIYIYIYIHVYVCVYIRVCMQPFLLAFEDRDISCPLSFRYVNMIQCRQVPWHPGGITERNPGITEYLWLEGTLKIT